MAEKGGLLSGVGKFFRKMGTNMGVVGEFLGFLWKRKMWWLIPMVVVLLFFALLMIFSVASGAGPLIYVLF